MRDFGFDATSESLKHMSNKLCFCRQTLKTKFLQFHIASNPPYVKTTLQRHVVSHLTVSWADQACVQHHNLVQSEVTIFLLEQRAVLKHDRMSVTGEHRRQQPLRRRHHRGWRWGWAVAPPGCWGGSWLGMLLPQQGLGHWPTELADRQTS